MGNEMRRARRCRQMGAFSIAAAAAATAVLAASGRAGVISSMENDVDLAHQPPGTGEPNAYLWGDSFDTNQVDRSYSLVGVTDGDRSMHVRKPNGGFSWGIQFLFNDPLNQPRYTDLVGAGTTDMNGNFTSTNPAYTKIMMDITTPIDPNVAYSVGFGAVNYGFVQNQFPGYFIDSYNPSGGGDYYQFTWPGATAPFRTSTYTWDLGGEFVGNGVPLWDHIGAYMIYHFNVNSGTLAVDSHSYWDNFRVVDENILTRPKWNGAAGSTVNWSSGSSWLHGVPNAVGAPAIFLANNPNTGTAALGVSVGVNVDGAFTVGSIIFDSTETSYTSNASPPPNRGEVAHVLSGNGSITFDVVSGKAEVYNIAGNTTINVPILVNDSLDVDASSGFGPDSGAPSGGRFSEVARTSIAFTNNATLASGVTLTTRGLGTISFGTITGSAAAVQINGGITNLTGNVNVSTFGVASSATAAMAANGSLLLKTGTLNVGSVQLGTDVATGRLDLNDNDMIVGSGTTKAAVEALVKNARDGGLWDKNGITSSAAAANTNHTTGLGVISGAEKDSAGGTGTFDGQAYSATDTLVKYTWNGDANLDGRVTFDDYVKIDTGFNTGLTGWFNGDFNYSGNVNFDDYVLIDVAFNQQNATLGRAVDWISGDDRSAAGLDAPGMSEVFQHLDQFGSAYGAAFLAAVPEPTSLALLGVPALAGIVQRRRRRREDLN